jgi:CO dehydrogenase/acetyl-CoA synthase gamma subunit (corrinoid Fe-S protein)
LSLPKINCGACGSPTCRTFAEDVIDGELGLYDCVILKAKKLENELKENESQTNYE